MAPFMSALPLCPLSKPKQTCRIREAVRVQQSHRPPSDIWKELNLSPRLFATNREGWSVTHWLWNNILAYITSRSRAGLVPPASLSLSFKEAKMMTVTVAREEKCDDSTARGRNITAWPIGVCHPVWVCMTHSRRFLFLFTAPPASGGGPSPFPFRNESTGLSSHVLSKNCTFHFLVILF